MGGLVRGGAVKKLSTEGLLAGRDAVSARISPRRLDEW